MPLKWVLHWHPNPGNAVNSQTLAEVSQCIQTLNGVKEGRWKASLTFYKPISRESTIPSDLPRDLIGITLPEQPSKYYFTLRSHRIVLEADLSIQNIMEKLQSYKARVVLNFEGFQYQLGDFQLRVGKVVTSHSENLRGIVMEVEYLPISSLEKSRRIMEEFIDIWQEVLSKRSLPGHFVHAEPNFSEYGLSDHYSSQHTAVQYATSVAQIGEGLVHQPLEPAKAMPYSSMIAPNIDFGGYMQSIGILEPRHSYSSCQPKMATYLHQNPQACRKLTLQTRGVNSNIGIKSVKLEPQHYGDLVPFREC